MRLETFVIKTLEQVNHVKVVAYRVSVFFLRKGRGVCVWPCINHDCHKLPRQPQLHDGERPQLTAAFQIFSRGLVFFYLLGGALTSGHRQLNRGARLISALVTENRLMATK